MFSKHNEWIFKRPINHDGSSTAIEQEITYVVLVPHDVKECIHGQIVVSSSEAGKGSEDASGEEHAMQVLLGVGKDSLHFLNVLGAAAHLTSLFCFTACDDSLLLLFLLEMKSIINNLN